MQIGDLSHLRFLLLLKKKKRTPTKNPNLFSATERSTTGIHTQAKGFGKTLGLTEGKDCIYSRICIHQQAPLLVYLCISKNVKPAQNASLSLSVPYLSQSTSIFIIYMKWNCTRSQNLPVRSFSHSKYAVLQQGISSLR